MDCAGQAVVVVDCLDGYADGCADGYAQSGHKREDGGGGPGEDSGLMGLAEALEGVLRPLHAAFEAGTTGGGTTGGGGSASFLGDEPVSLPRAVAVLVLLPLPALELGALSQQATTSLPKARAVLREAMPAPLRF